jgi:hypothetical protein
MNFAAGILSFLVGVEEPPGPLVWKWQMGIAALHPSYGIGVDALPERFAPCARIVVASFEVEPLRGENSMTT